ncbi:MAG: Asp23/Gls24 family envelope stress response protein [Candidatus Omnitrophica bacterium]|nr:Asp23/Gls24 family envelope stress response protein [Candidatus Omnitrophota bacterium]
MAGLVRINNEAIARIASIAVKEVPGVVGVSSGFRIGRFSIWGGVRVDANETEIKIRVPIAVEYGVHLPRVAVEVQERVREAVSRMTDINVIEVDVSVQEIKEASLRGGVR